MRPLLPVVRLVPVALLAAAATACSGGHAAPNGQATPGPRGGTLQVLATADALATDPQQARTPADADLDRLLFRGLTAFPAEPDGATDAVPDLATGRGTPSDGAKTWTFHLRPGLTFADGSRLTAADVRYGVERNFDPKIADMARGGTPAYVTDVLDCGKAYHGPTGGDCPAIDTPDARTVVFHLRRPVGDFPDLVALPAFAPMSTGGEVVASGPYVVDARSDTGLVLARNPNWDAATDPVRPALPDRIEVSLGVDPVAAADRMRTDSGATAVPLGDGLPPVRAQAALQAQPPADQAFDGTVDLLLLDTAVRPLDNVAVRQALERAVNRTDYLDAVGGPSAGTPSTTLLPPSLPAHRAFDLYAGPANPKQQIARAGYPDGISLSLAVDGVDAAAADAVRTALEQAGVTVTTPSAGASAALLLTRFRPARPAPAAYIRPLFCGCGTADSTHYSAQDRRIAALVAATSPPPADWAKLDARILQDAPAVPLVDRQVVRVHGAKVGRTFLSPALGGQYDLAALAVTS